MRQYALRSPASRVQHKFDQGIHKLLSPNRRTLRGEYLNIFYCISILPMPSHLLSSQVVQADTTPVTHLRVVVHTLGAAGPKPAIIIGPSTCSTLMVDHPLASTWELSLVIRPGSSIGLDMDTSKPPLPSSIGTFQLLQGSLYYSLHVS